MKIYFASQSFYPHIGGVSTYLLNLEKEMIKRGHDVTELHLRPAEAPNEDVVEGIPVIRVPKEPLDKDMLKSYSKFKEALYKECHGYKGSFGRTPIEMEGYDDFIQINDAFGQEVRDMLNQDPADIVHIHDFQLIYLYRYVPRGIPLIFTWHIPLSTDISTHLKKFLVKHLSEYDKLIFSSPNYIDAAVKIGIPKEKCELIYPVCNTKLFTVMDIDRKKILKKYDIPADSKVIMSVQRVDPKSGHEQLIKALPYIREKVPNAKLVFVGGESMSNKLSKSRQVYQDRVNELIEELELKEHVIFTGNIDYNNLPEVYNAADVVALCSKDEGFGLSITEGMSCGKPIVGTKAGGIPLQIKDGVNGYLVDVGDHKNTAHKLAKILSDDKLKEKFGEASLERVEKHFKLELGVDKHIHVYNTTLNEKDEARRLEKMREEDVIALITDFDRTITDKPGELKKSTVKKLRELDTIHILATGRNLKFVKKIAAEFKLWDCIVCENGAIVYFPESKKTLTVNSEYMDQARTILKENKIKAVYGDVVISVDKKISDKVKELLEEISKNLNYNFNVNEMMILPKYVNKGSGVDEALHNLKIEPENTILVGDAENDYDLFRVPGFKVAVANAHPRLKLVSDQVTEKPGSEGIKEIVDKLKSK